MIAGAGHEGVGIYVSGVHEVALRLEAFVLKRRVHVGQDGPVHHRRRRGFNVGDQVGLSDLASFREVNFVADPRRMALLGIADVEIMGRRHHHGRWRIAFHFGAPAQDLRFDGFGWADIVIQPTEVRIPAVKAALLEERLAAEICPY